MRLAVSTSLWELVYQDSAIKAQVASFIPQYHCNQSWLKVYHVSAKEAPL
jgi:hypothetical protein